MKDSSDIRENPCSLTVSRVASKSVLIRSYILLFLTFSLLSEGRAEDMTGTTYKVKQGLFGIGGFVGGTSTYNLQDILGVLGMSAMQGTIYALNPGLYNLNSLPQVTVSNYNDSRPIEDPTPTLTWTYADSDNDTQKKYQLQVGRGGFTTIVMDTGEISSVLTSYTTSLLPRTEERTPYKWRIRANDGFGWSGWAQANNGFVLTTSGFVISELFALTAPGGATITDATWQKDNDPYFYWEAPASELEVSGYSFSLDEAPDDEVDSTSSYYSFPQDQISDGAHIFYVKAKRSSGLWGEAAGFNLWVDTTAPTANSFSPALGGVISSDQPEVKAVLSDAASGINPDAIEMRINQAKVTPVYNSESGTVSFLPSVPFSDGEIIVSLKAQDAVGNLGSELIWSFVIDTTGPAGSILINSGDEMTTTNIVSLNISAEDEVTNITEMLLSNDGVFDTEAWEPYVSLRRNWVLPAINGARKIYAKVKDEAGNISDAFFDEINLVIIAPETYILSGPSGITPLTNAEFHFRGSLDNCQFSYKFDNEDWSDWSSDISITKASLSEGNHYFMVRSAKDLNKDNLLQLDEVDPTPALRVWTVSFSGAFKPPTQPEQPVKQWEQD